MNNFWSLTTWTLLVGIFAASGQLQTDAECPPKFISLDGAYCVHLDGPSSWNDATHTAARAAASWTILDLLLSNNSKTHETRCQLLDWKVDTLWVEARRSGYSRHILYQLPASERYYSRLDGRLAQSDVWKGGRPTLEPDMDCLVLQVVPGNSSAACNVGFRLWLDECGEAKHKHVSVVHLQFAVDGPARETLVECAGSMDAVKKGVLRTVHDRSCEVLTATGGPSKLIIREEGATGPVLEVYNPAGLWLSGQHELLPGSLSCVMDGADIGSEGLLPLQHLGDYAWLTAVGDGYLFTKADYRVLSGDLMGYVQCRAFLDQTMAPIRSRKLGISLPNRKTYSVSLNYKLNSSTFTQLNVSEPTFNIQFWKNVTEFKAESNLVNHVSPVAMTDIRKPQDDPSSIVVTWQLRVVLLDMTPSPFSLPEPFNVHRLEVALAPTPGTNFTSILSTSFCPEERINIGDTELQFPDSPVGRAAYPDKPCLGRNGGPVRSSCEGDFVHGAKWNHTELSRLNRCNRPVNDNELELLAYQKSETLGNPSGTIRRLQALMVKRGRLKSASKMTPTEFHYVTQILSNVASANLNLSLDDLPNVAGVIDGILEKTADLQSNIRPLDNTVSESSAVLVHSLDKVLNSLQLDEGKLSNSGDVPTSLIVTPRYCSLVVTMNDTDIGFQGLAALTRKQDNALFNSQDVILLSSNLSLEEIAGMGIEVAVLLPPTLMRALVDQSEKLIAHRLVVNLFWTETLFRSANRRNSRILGITLNGRKYNNLQPPVRILFGNRNRRRGSCVFWDFEARAHQGDWSGDGCTLAPQSAYLAVDVCVCTHLTHFTEILHDFPPERDTVLDTITVIGCTLSLMGLAGIALTAVLFPEFRKGAGQKVQLHISTAVALLIASFMVYALVEDKSYQLCIANGVVLHYSVLASFAWMVATAALQFLRLVSVFAAQRTSHLIFKVSIISWGLPIIPCTILLGLDINNYGPDKCFPTQGVLYYSVFLPVTACVVCNTIIFALIIRTLFCTCGSKLRSNQSDRSMHIHRLITSVFLFTLFGLSWVFGIFNCPIMFCSTATLQGLAFFVFFVALEKKSRAKWMRAIFRSPHDDASSSPVTSSKTLDS